MEDILKYEEIVKSLLEEYAHEWSTGGQLEFGVLFDSERHRYQLISMGWMGDDYIHHVPIHIDIKGGKVWLQKNMTEEYVAEALVARGIPQKSIVLGLQPPEYRKYTTYAEA
jgi:hypothetical protein